MKLVLFDLDGTLIAKDSDHAFGGFLVALGWADAAQFAAENDRFYRQYQAGRLDIDAYVDFATRPWRTRAPAEQAVAVERFMREQMVPAIGERARALVRSHLAAGDRVAIATSTNEFITRPIADAFGVDALIATELERDAQGRVTGRIRGVPALREGKLRRVQAWLSAQGLALHDFAASVCYSDSTNDLPLLEAVSEPVATNPSPALAAIARERGWRILDLFE
ncbi:MAG TPA: HAD family hydrolase [Burkholderiaceae bacterium]|nr:HAD family hydrolase [Burkholderiaceae bacterium]